MYTRGLRGGIVRKKGIPNGFTETWPQWWHGIPGQRYRAIVVAVVVVVVIVVVIVVLAAVSARSRSKNTGDIDKTHFSVYI